MRPCVVDEVHEIRTLLRSPVHSTKEDGIGMRRGRIRERGESEGWRNGVEIRREPSDGRNDEMQEARGDLSGEGGGESGERPLHPTIRSPVFVR